MYFEVLSSCSQDVFIRKCWRHHFHWFFPLQTERVFKVFFFNCLTLGSSWAKSVVQVSESIPCYCYTSRHNFDKCVLRWTAILLVTNSPRNWCPRSIISNKPKSVKCATVGKKNNLGETDKTHFSQKVPCGMIIFFREATFEQKRKQAMSLIHLLQFHCLQA